MGRPQRTPFSESAWVGRSAHPSVPASPLGRPQRTPGARPITLHARTNLLRLPRCTSKTTCISNLCMPVTGSFHCQAHTCMDVKIHGMLRSTANVSLVWVRTPSRFRLSFGSAAAHTRSSSYHSACTDESVATAKVHEQNQKMSAHAACN